MTQKWYAKPHAVQRVNERFGIETKLASNWINQHMEAATYVNNVVDDHGVERRLFTDKGILFFADKAVDVIVSVRKAEAKREFLAKISGPVEKELRNKQRRVLEIEREMLVTRTEMERELIDLRLATLRTRSDLRKATLGLRISELEIRVRDINQALFSEKRELTLFTEGLIAIS